MTYSGTMELIGANQDLTNESFLPQPGFHELLIELYDSRSNVRLERQHQLLNVSPAVSDDLRDRVLEHWSALSAFLPGNCDHCKEYAFMRVELYWEPHAHLCRDCVKQVVTHFDQHGWPAVDMETEEVL